MKLRRRVPLPAERHPLLAEHHPSLACPLLLEVIRLLPAESRQSPADHRQLPEENLPLPPGADHQLQWEHRRWKLENHPLRLEYRQCPLTYFHPLRVQRHPLPERHPSPSPWCLPSLPASRQFREDCRRWRRR